MKQNWSEPESRMLRNTLDKTSSAGPLPVAGPGGLSIKGFGDPAKDTACLPA
jgi:hypothetical protein